MTTARDKGWQSKAPPLQGRGSGWGMSVEQIEWLHARAKEMRKNPTEPEKRLWRYLSNSRIEGLKFRRQEVVGPYIADLMCPSASLIVEVDGDTHDEAKDRLRDDVLAQWGFLVLRVTNLDVMQNADGVVEAIRLAAAGRVSRHFPPSPYREGPGVRHVSDGNACSSNDIPHPNPSPEGEGLEKAPQLAGISLVGSVR